MLDSNVNVQTDDLLQLNKLIFFKSLYRCVGQLLQQRDF